MILVTPVCKWAEDFFLLEVKIVNFYGERELHMKAYLGFSFRNDILEW